jgi:nucleoside-diphosphate-sugar epimerase
MLLQAHREGKVRAAVGRCSDFFGPGVVEAAMGARVFDAARLDRPASVLGNVDVLHTQAFIDDVAAGLVTLGHRAEALGAVWHLPSAETLTTRQFLQLVYANAGFPLRFRSAPRWLVSTMALVNAQMRELKEILYTFERPLVVDHGKFERAFGPLPVTPHAEAIRQTGLWFEQAGAKVDARTRAASAEAAGINPT